MIKRATTLAAVALLVACALAGANADRYEICEGVPEFAHGVMEVRSTGIPVNVAVAAFRDKMVEMGVDMGSEGAKFVLESVQLAYRMPNTRAYSNIERQVAESMAYHGLSMPNTGVMRGVESTIAQEFANNRYMRCLQTDWGEK